MKIQSLAVISIIIILPMAILLNVYSTNQIQTLDFQISYDSKLKTATYDAIKAFQLNMSNSSTSDIVDSKMRDIKASTKTFYNSLASNFDMAGYGEEVLKDYVPAVVYTLYDGYYIYAAYENTLDENDKDKFYEEATYKDGETIYGLRPYIYYSCRYKTGDDDFVITYSLDNYITIQGKINGQNVNDSGYLLSGVERAINGVTYNNIRIETEYNRLIQNVYIEGDSSGQENRRIKIEGNVVGSIKQCKYRKINGVKYYLDETTNEVFSILNDKKFTQNQIKSESILNNDNAVKYYREAAEFKNRIINDYGLTNLSTEHVVDINGNKYTDENNPYDRNIKIFEELQNTDYHTKHIEDEDSNFNTHRRQVIRNAIETSLIPAISNYNKVSTSEVNFAMPKLKEYEWDFITDDVSMITFLQGLSIGGKIYNGYSIVPNKLSEEFVSEDSIYIAKDGIYYRRTDFEFLNTQINDYNTIGVWNIDFERRTSIASIGNRDAGTYIEKNVYYFPREELGAYTSIINPNTPIGKPGMSIEEFKYAADYGGGSQRYMLAQKYYTALGRERYGIYRVNNDMTKILQDLQN